MTPGRIQRNNRLRLQLETVARQAWPDIFNPEAPVPLALGIHKEIKAALPTASAEGIKCFLSSWTNQPAYLRAFPDYLKRRHLDGTLADDITEEHKANAMERWNALRKKAADKLARGRRSKRQAVKGGAG